MLYLLLNMLKSLIYLLICSLMDIVISCKNAQNSLQVFAHITCWICNITKCIADYSYAMFNWILL